MSEWDEYSSSVDSRITMRLILSTKWRYWVDKSPNDVIDWTRIRVINFLRSSSLSMRIWALVISLSYFPFLENIWIQFLRVSMSVSGFILYISFCSCAMLLRIEFFITELRLFTYSLSSLCFFESLDSFSNLRYFDGFIQTSASVIYRFRAFVVYAARNNSAIK